MFGYSSKDLYRYCGRNDLRSFLKTWYYEQSYRYIFYYRIAKANKGKSLTAFIARYFMRKLSYKLGIQIPHEVIIGEGFYIGHFGAIVVNPETIIGRNCNIAPGVTIGQANRGEKKGVPVIGSNVWIGANSIIVGKIKIGDDVLIAPGAYVNFDVPDHSLVFGNPASIKSRDNATDGYINNSV